MGDSSKSCDNFGQAKWFEMPDPSGLAQIGTLLTMSSSPPIQPRTLGDFLEEQGQAGRERTEMLGELLSVAMSRKGYYLAFASCMGRTGHDGHLNATGVPSYTVLHSLEWISQNVRLGSEMPFMENKIDHETGRLVVDYSNADEVKQRAPDWTRQAALAAYLAQPQRKFGPIMAVVSPDWVENPEHENWDADGRARRSAVDFTPIEPGGAVGLIRLHGVRVYALDGQHRVLGMRGLRELRDHGFLQLRGKDGSPKEAKLGREDFFASFGLRIEELQAIFNDTMPVEYTPAVVVGETHADATRRIRRTFIAINSYAKKTDKGENILLDETDGFAIVARRVAVNHPMFEGGTKKRVNWKTTSIPSGRTPFLTTLSALQEVAAIYLAATQTDVVGKWKSTMSGAVPVRPPDEELDAGYAALAEFFDYLWEMPVFRRLADVNPDEEQAFLEKWREFPRFSRTGAVVEGTGGFRGHLLLRPLGQIILARAVAEMAYPEELGGLGLSLQTIFRRLARLDEDGGFEAHRPSNVWWGVTYTPATNRILNRGKSWGHKLLVQLVAGIEDEQERQDLWWQWVSARGVDLRAKTWKNLDGRVARFDWNVPELPQLRR